MASIAATHHHHHHHHHHQHSSGVASSSSSSGAHLQVPGAAQQSSSPLSSSSSPLPVRPKFNSHLTSDRLREGAGLYLPPLFKMPSSNIRKGRVSVFKELGLDDLTPCQLDDKFLGRGTS